MGTLSLWLDDEESMVEEKIGVVGGGGQDMRGRGGSEERRGAVFSRLKDTLI
jgi:hypothetical protein